MDLDKLAFIMSLKNNGSGSSSKPIDAQVNGESENAVQNKAIWEFVNSSVANNTAYFKGTYSSLAKLEAITDVTNNDYAFVISVDDAGNTVYNRYKYNGNAWLFEYALNNSSFTANQWDTINSGITSVDIQNLEDNKVDKVAGKGLSTEDYTAEDKATVESLVGADAKLAGVSSESALNSQTLGYQRKNLLKRTDTSETKNGVTFTVNEDGSVTANGTATDGTASHYIGVKITVPAGEYIMSGCPADGSTDTYRMSCYNTSWSNAIHDYGGGIKISFTDDTVRMFTISVAPGKQVENLTFYPMLRYAEITDNTYEPYKPSVEERLAALEAAIMGGGA